MVGFGDIFPYGLGAVGALFITTEEISLAESQSGISFQEAKPAAGAPFIEFSKWFMPIEAGKLLGLYFVQDYIDQPFAEKVLHGLMFGNVAVDLLYWLKPGAYRFIMGKFSGLVGGFSTTEAAI